MNKKFQKLGRAVVLFVCFVLLESPFVWYFSMQGIELTTEQHCYILGAFAFFSLLAAYAHR